MGIRRRDFLMAGATAVATVGSVSRAFAQRGGDMYGLIGKMTAAPGKRDELISILLEGAATMPGCLSYIVAKDTGDANAIWITEAWDSKASHEASLSLPSVKEAIAKGRPLIAGFSDRVVTTPVGGTGLALPDRPR
ncbi:MAG TPA: putative quinol monooxygenase [Bryobacteraceae bacterium]|nr:putative quinol monooxygenase [Bryobacteraceae bacterium]